MTKTIVAKILKLGDTLTFGTINAELMKKLGYQKCVYAKYLKDTDSVFRDMYIPMGMDMELKQGYTLIDNKDTLIDYKGEDKIIFDGDLDLQDCTKCHNLSNLIIVTGCLNNYGTGIPHDFSGLTYIGDYGKS